MSLWAPRDPQDIHAELPAGNLNVWVRHLKRDRQVGDMMLRHTSMQIIKPTGPGDVCLSQEEPRKSPGREKTRRCGQTPDCTSGGERTQEGVRGGAARAAVEPERRAVWKRE